MYSPKLSKPLILIQSNRLDDSQASVSPPCMKKTPVSTGMCIANNDDVVQSVRLLQLAIYQYGLDGLARNARQRKRAPLLGVLLAETRH
jgi:hypothetical protein